MSWPSDVGILGIELVFPSLYIDQTELEQFDGVSAGKYTVGLGQSKMGFCTDREDINSLCLTVVSNLLKHYNVNPKDIGRLEVGTETIIDKSKSVKSVLMQLFDEHGATDLEGIDTTNACYGGTAALFNAINWIESSSYDGRLALVVCGDIAVYAAGSARPTGGAGAIAMLIGPNAPLVFDRKVRSTYMKHAYDFYKPDLTSEFPVVDGKLSIQCYLSALDSCYRLYCEKYQKQNPGAEVIGLNQFDALVFHTPYCKLVQKSLGRVSLNDFLLTTDPEKRKELYPAFYEKFDSIKLEETYFDRDIEKLFMDYSKDTFNKKTKPSLLLANQVGNMYTPSVYSGLVSYLISADEDVNKLLGKHIGVFSYGSGLASTMYSISVTNDCTKLQPLLDKLNYVKPLLEQRIKISPQEFTELMEVRVHNSHRTNFEPSGAIDRLFPGTYYLKYVDDMHRRTYEKRE
ncbi:hydroxymethylglutaryl-CoA synthase 1 [Chironomus tepperi]|uniref:hydroxymethylglutaryl-CoA synthase 1 n=1 Tax=Chironomus tepperi TaxID=113505 RepID=UPI00391FB8FC